MSGFPPDTRPDRIDMAEMAAKGYPNVQFPIAGPPHHQVIDGELVLVYEAIDYMNYHYDATLNRYVR